MREGQSWLLILAVSALLAVGDAVCLLGLWPNHPGNTPALMVALLVFVTALYRYGQAKK